MEHGDAQLAGPCGDDRVLFRGQDQQLEPRLAQGRDAEPVAAVHGDEFASFGVDQHPVVGLGAVEVDDDGVDVVAGGEGARCLLRVEERREGAGAGQVVRVVDLQDAGRVRDDERGPPEEAVPGLAESGGVHGVRRAGLQEVLRTVLAAGAEALVVVDAFRGGLGGRGGLAPDEAVEGGHRVGRVRAVLDDRGADAVDVLAYLSRLFTLSELLDTAADDQHALVTTAGGGQGTTGLAVLRTGQRSAWQPLPHDGMGAVLDPVELPQQIARLLALLLRLPLPDPLSVALGIGIDPATMVSEDTMSRLPRSTAQFPMRHDLLRVHPDESLTMKELNAKSDSVAEELAARLLASFRTPRRSF